MLDTVILTIPRGSYKLRAEAFTPNANILKMSGNYLVKCVNNPTASDKKAGAYKPRLTLMKRMTRNGDEIPLKIEFSVAKMLYGNNVDDLKKPEKRAMDKDQNFLQPSLFDALIKKGKKEIAEDLKFLDDISAKTYHGWIGQISESIERFEPYKTNL